MGRLVRVRNAVTVIVWDGGVVLVTVIEFRMAVRVTVDDAVEMFVFVGVVGGWA